MALLDSEIQRIRYELGWALTTVNAEPYIGYIAVFTQVIQPYLSAGASTTSTTSVTAATPGTTAPVTITLASGTGFSAPTRVVVDVDDRQEVATAQNISGASLTVLLSKAHTGTYPVTVEGGESIIREILARIRDVKNELGSTFGEGTVKKVDEIEFYEVRGMSRFGALGEQLKFWRRELSQALCNGQGLNMWEQMAVGASRVSVY